MPLGVDEVLAQLETLRRDGSEGFDPVQAAFIQALARRTRSQQGPARALLESRLGPLLEAFRARCGMPRAAALRAAESAAPHAAPPVASSAIARIASHRSSPLGELLLHAARAESGGPETAVGGLHQPAAVPAAAVLDPQGGASAGAPRELKALRQFRRTWSRLSVQVRLTQSVAKGPENAGPLNSHGLALRALQGMQEIAPDYLEHFMAYFEALQWLDQAAGSVSLPPARAAAPAAEAPRKPGRKKAG